MADVLIIPATHGVTKVAPETTEFDRVLAEIMSEIPPFFNKTNVKEALENSYRDRSKGLWFSIVRKFPEYNKYSYSTEARDLILDQLTVFEGVTMYTYILHGFPVMEIKKRPYVNVTAKNGVQSVYISWTI